jgi:cyclophilin family peptidyl-prolyl cis-trans isomerase
MRSATAEARIAGRFRKNRYLLKSMFHRLFCWIVVYRAAVSFSIAGAPTIDPISNAGVPAGKSLIIPVTATSPSGLPLTFSATSSTNGITIQVHTNNPFWRMSVVQAASPSAPGAYQTPFRGGVTTVTNIGDMTFMLFRDIAPHTVDVIQGLTAGGMYTSNTIFHRVIAGFMNQGGDPLTNGSGGPVFRYDDEFHPQAIFSGNGQLALANSGKDTDGSQFFITVAPFRFGDFGYTIFGQLVRGFNVLSNINNTAVDTNSLPLAAVIITKASLVPDNFDTVLTLVGTNKAGVAGTIKVIADDGAGGRTTNSFTATTVADVNLEAPFLYPNRVANLVAPVNKWLTNFVFGYDFPGATNHWAVYYADANSSVSATNSFFDIVTNQMKCVVVPNTNYVGPVSLIFYVSASPTFGIYDQQTHTFAFGDTVINAIATNFTAQALTPFSNQLIATFTNGVPNSPTSKFTAFINWGDNSTNSGIITTNSLGRKEVRGSHSYTNSGDYPVYITIQSTLGASATVVATSTVPPSLSLTRSGTNNSVGWPAWAFAYQLLSSTDFTSTNWVAITNISSLVAYQDVVTNGTTNSKLFFRLKK